MLFDLRSPRRRNAVRVIYVFLALMMVIGLVFVGVGTGNSNGGLLNAIGGSGSGSNSGQNSLIQQQVASAEKAVKANPSSAKAWAALVEAQWEAAGSGSGVTSTGAFTATGKKYLADAAQSWQQYVTVSGQKPNQDTSILAAGVYQGLSDWKNESSAWEFAISAPGAAKSAKTYICLALSAYADGQTSQGELAQTEGLKLTPSLQRITIKSALSAAKSSKKTAQETVVEDC